MFDYPLTPEVLKWLAAGRLDDRLQRSLRLWVLLTRLYGQPGSWAKTIPNPFRYKDLSQRLFASSHSQQEGLPVEALTRDCKRQNSLALRRSACVCQYTLADWLEDYGTSMTIDEWRQAIVHLTGMSPGAVDAELQKFPFATVHRSIRKDLSILAEQGWLLAEKRGQYRCCSSERWPQLMVETSLDGISSQQSWEILRALESISFIQPNLELAIRTLWEQLTLGKRLVSGMPVRRIFVHLDYILSEADQERVDTFQEQIERLWQTNSGVLAFDYAYREKQIISTVVYPVCLHYARRAKYLSAYGQTPEGRLGWHNYRLDRIVSQRLNVLPWDALPVDSQLRRQHLCDDLPTPIEVEAALEEAWGFNFYHRKQFLLMRFPSEFARRYVQNTDRHDTFVSVNYDALPNLIEQHVPTMSERAQALAIVHERSASDTYYQGWIREDDINIVMRLRDWRPKGEVIAPASMRQRMHQEALQEITHYQL